MPLEQTQEPEQELKEMRRPILGFSVPPAVNNSISGDFVITDNHLEGHSDTSSSGSSSSSSSGSSSESDLDEDSRANSHYDSEHHNPAEESQCEDVYLFKDVQENPLPSLQKKKTVPIKVKLNCGKKELFVIFKNRKKKKKLARIRLNVSNVVRKL